MQQIVADTHSRMDAMYRYQRYIYDATRKYYLLGRDLLLDRLPIDAGDTVLEIGCGTGRNLRKLARSYPATQFFGLDASSVMLETAAKKVCADGLKNVRFRTALAESFHHAVTFDRQSPFDVIFFSYSLSMIPSWRDVIDVTIANLTVGGTLAIVDFYDQANLPPFFKKGLQGWLLKFDVKPSPALVPHLRELHDDGIVRLSVSEVARRYAVIASMQKL
jgi:S-adenosylmethionine-diacylgycerolhomoserine-N-methlytransferase